MLKRWFPWFSPPHGAPWTQARIWAHVLILGFGVVLLVVLLLMLNGALE